MTQQLTSLKKAIKNDPGTGELVSVAELNAAFDKFDNHFIPSCKIYADVTQSIPNASTTQVAYNQNRHDSFAGRSEGAMADASNDRIIIRFAGLYRVTTHVSFATNATGYRAVSIKKNASVIKRVTTDANGTAGIDTSFGVSDDIDCAVNDLITATCLQTSGAALNADPTLGGIQDNVSLTVTWLGRITEV